MMSRYNATLLIGSTGSGKTPVGDCLEKNGLWGRRCIHFDFGANLRAIVQGGANASALSEEDLAVIRQSLETGRLLEDKDFRIAAKILREFVLQRAAGACDVVLNGLPRHVGQAKGIEEIVEVSLVVALECPIDVVLKRIRSNVGGDREVRIDDDPAAIESKLSVFRERTLPLLDHYRTRGVRIVTVAVNADTTPEDVIRRMEGSKDGFERKR